MSRARTILAGSVGNAVEWFDWTIYASFAIFFSSQFFPEGNETTALLASFGIFAVGFFMRPVGGWLLGIFSDRYGRKAWLTILMMAGGSLIIAVTPTYATIGLAAPLLLTAARLLQGLSLGGGMPRPRPSWRKWRRPTAVVSIPASCSSAPPSASWPRPPWAGR